MWGKIKRKQAQLSQACDRTGSELGNITYLFAVISLDKKYNKKDEPIRTVNYPKPTQVTQYGKKTCSVFM
jgi:hypothetical protein